MASPIPTVKQSVNLAATAGRPSRIRREPPPRPAPVKAKADVDPDERDAWMVILGVLSFALAIAVVAFVFSSYAGWSPRQYTIQL